MAERHIVALGGGGFVSQGQFTPLDEYVLALARRSPPRVCFLATASGDSDDNIVKFYRAYSLDRCLPTHLPLFSRPDELRPWIRDQDAIYVGGGNTANMLAVWRLHGVDALLREAWEAGTVLAGVSAGALCWFECGITDSFGPALAPLRDGLALLAGSFCPHYDSEPRRRPTYQRLVAEGLPGGYAAEDGVALHFVGTRLAEVVRARPEARAYEVRATPDGVRELPLPARSL